MNPFLYALYVSVKRGTPLLLGTTGEIMTEKSGSLNLGLEGLMALGAIGGFCIGCASGSLFVALLGAFLSGGLGAALYAFLTVTLQANQNVTGLTLTIFGVGIMKFVGATLYSQGKFPAVPESISKYTVTSGNNLFDQNILVYIAIAIAVVCWIYIKFSRSGMQMRAIGENPAAADAVGVKVTLKKYLSNIVGGGIAGIGGLYMGLVINGGVWNENWINGFGWISLALVIFSGWSPLLAILGAYLFGLLNSLQSLAGTFALNYPALAWMGKIPPDFYQMLPFLITAIILIINSAMQKKDSSSPTACGVNYYREER